MHDGLPEDERGVGDETAGTDGEHVTVRSGLPPTKLCAPLAVDIDSFLTRSLDLGGFRKRLLRGSVADLVAGKVVVRSDRDYTQSWLTGEDEWQNGRCLGREVYLKIGETDRGRWCEHLWESRPKSHQLQLEVHISSLVRAFALISILRTARVARRQTARTGFCGKVETAARQT